jgi:hypothetical protein
MSGYEVRGIDHRLLLDEEPPSTTKAGQEPAWCREVETLDRRSYSCAVLVGLPVVKLTLSVLAWLAEARCSKVE